MAHFSFSNEIPVCVDGRMLGDGGTGVSTYARTLARATSQLTTRSCILSATSGNAFSRVMRSMLFGTHAIHCTATKKGCIILTGQDVFRTAHVHFGIKRRLYRLRTELPAGIMHWSYPVPIVLEGWTNIYTVHDAIPIDRPDLSPVDSRRYRATLAAIVERGDRIVTVSADARTSIIRAMGCRSDFVVDAGQAVDLADEAIIDAPVAGAYLLCVGSIEPRKNLSAILAAYRSSGLSMPLLIAGPDGWCAGPILAEIAATPGALRLPYQSRAAMLGLLRGARALVFPTLAEGFGLPAVEAMALGTPVLTSDRGALAEVVGDAALTINPTNVASITAALRQIATNDALALHLSISGKSRAATFSMARFVDRLTAIYEETLSNRHEGANGLVR